MGIKFFTLLLVTFTLSCSPSKKSGVEKRTKKTSAEQIWVFKYDGSKQCGTGGDPIPLNQMKKQMGQIQVFKTDHKNDGMMRTMVCGSDTGNAHLFLISKSDLNAAKKLGFNQWKFE